MIAPVVASALLILGIMPDKQTNEKSTDIHEELIYDSDLPYREQSELYEPEWQSYTVTSGDNFSLLGSRLLSLTPSEIIKIADTTREAIDLAQLKTGQKIQYLLNKEGKLQELKFSIKSNLDYLVKRQDSTFSGQKINKSSTKIHQIYKGVISNNLSSSMQTQGVPYTLASKAGTLLEKRNNLRRDLRAGDRFDILIVSDEVDGELFSPKIEAIRLNGHRIKSALYLHSDGYYYDEQGKSLEPGFNRYPLEQSFRISSPFNLNRKHPVTGLVRPHYGTDFATPTGTPVTSPAEGIVKRVGYQQYAGHYLVVEHYNGYVTRYFHLSKSLVKEGESVAIGTKIALTGNSGRTTGAHLHYELHKNGSPVDPMLVNLPSSRNLEGKELAAFQEQVLQKVAALDQSNTKLALSVAEEEENTPKS